MFWENKDLERLGKTVIKTFGDLNHLDDKCCRIGYQYSDQAKKSKGMLVMADTEIVKPKLKTFMPYDFIITFYEPNCVGLDEKRMERLMYHELKHVGFEVPDQYWIEPHDFEDFRAVLDKWGTDWLRNDES